MINVVLTEDNSRGDRQRSSKPTQHAIFSRTFFFFFKLFLIKQRNTQASVVIILSVEMLLSVYLMRLPISEHNQIRFRRVL